MVVSTITMKLVSRNACVEGEKKPSKMRGSTAFMAWQCPQQRELASFNSDVTLLTIINWSFNTSWINKWVSWKNVAGEGRRGELQDQSTLVCSGLGDASGESVLLLPGCAPKQKVCPAHRYRFHEPTSIWETAGGELFLSLFFTIPLCYESGNVAGTNRIALHVGSVSFPLTFAFPSFCYYNHLKVAVCSCKHT